MQRTRLSRKWMAVILAVGLAFPFAAAMTPDDGSAKRLAEVLKTVKITASAAIAVAERDAHGTAFGVEFEVEKGIPRYAVKVLVADGPKIVEVEINARNGEVIEIESDDEEGDKDEKKDDDEDDDEDDDDKDEEDD